MIQPAPNAVLNDRLAQVASVLDKQVFFVCGCQKSGTTWIQKLLDGHPAVRCDGEAYFGPLLKQVLNQSIGLYNQNHKAGPPGNFEKDDVRLLFAFACGITFARWIGAKDVQAIGEKTPEHALCLRELVQCFPGCKAIHVIRDGRDVCVSGWFHNLRQGGDKFRERFPDLPRYIAYTVAKHWVPYITQARTFGAEYPELYHEVRYEELHATPHEQVRAMLAFLGVDASDESVEACIDAGSFNKLANGRDRGEADPQSFFRKGVVGDWREHFDADCEATFMRTGGVMLKELGYVS